MNVFNDQHNAFSFACCNFPAAFFVRRVKPWIVRTGKNSWSLIQGYHLGTDCSNINGLYVINRAMYLCNPRFSWGEIGQEMAWQSRRVQKPVYSIRNFFSSTLSISICDRSAQFLVNCFEKIFILTNNSGFNSIYMFACKWRGTRKRKKRKGREQELTGEEDSWGKFMQHLRLVFW